MPDTGLSGKTVLITGGNFGIGAATVRAFAAEGSLVVMHYLAEERLTGASSERERTRLHAVPGAAAAEALVSEIRGEGRDVTAVQGDLADPDVIPRLFDEAGPVDVLVNNAAHCEVPDALADATPDSLDRHFAVNSRAPTLLMAEFVRRYRARNASAGRIINVSTDAAQTFATQLGYGASKAALEALTRAAAYEVGPLGITVNAVAPGPVQTGYITAELEGQLLPTIPLRRLGRPEDIADVIVFLASAQAGWVTGQVIRVSGGHVM